MPHDHKNNVVENNKSNNFDFISCYILMSYSIMLVYFDYFSFEPLQELKHVFTQLSEQLPLQPIAHPSLQVPAQLSSHPLLQ